jgi:hypothetical protein
MVCPRKLRKGDKCRRVEPELPAHKSMKPLQQIRIVYRSDTSFPSKQPFLAMAMTGPALPPEFKARPAPDMAMERKIFGDG